MHPTLFSIGPISIHTYGVLVAIAFIIAWHRLSVSLKILIPNEKILDGFVIGLLISGIIGARIYYCILNTSFFIHNPIEIVMIFRGGLVWYGGVVGALAFGYVYAQYHQLSKIDLVDRIAPELCLAQAIGRMGCFFQGCCYSLDSVWAPVQLVESAALLVLFFILIKLRSIWLNQRGLSIACYALGYGVIRLCTEILRGDSVKVALGLSIAQWLSIALILLASIYFKRRAINSV
ncbi:MAG: phosphatidylglycerol:prolipoprotein diacylglycerol transferase [Candidatus Omnitrophota bacterium]|jgi:phosphatidylglycerol:prolipoprotein diacylglycerol transferase